MTNDHGPARATKKEIGDLDPAGSTVSRRTTAVPEVAAPEVVPEVVVVVAPENLILARIKTLADLANAVQNEELKRVILGLQSGERLYTLFAESVSREIEGMMNSRGKEAPKEMLDSLGIAAELKNIVLHTHAMMVEINRAPVMGVLGMLNQNLGGTGLQPYQSDGAGQPQNQGQTANRQPDRSGHTGPARGINTVAGSY
jgi:hypothetical protein